MVNKIFLVFDLVYQYRIYKRKEHHKKIELIYMERITAFGTNF